MSKKPTSKKTGQTDDGLRPMTDEEVLAAAEADPDARPLTPADLKRMKRVPQVKIIRRALGLTQEEFADRYLIPLGTLRDWEQGRSEPDQPAKAYLRVIAKEPSVTARALERSAA
jgi:putative transcriptional regulator